MVTMNLSPRARLRLLADDGSVLTTGWSLPLVEGGEVVLSSVRSKGALLRYYFAEGKRRVILDLGDFRLPGRLSTTWAGGERVWRVELMSAASTSGKESP